MKTERPAVPEHRVTVQNIVEWQSLRARHDEFALDPLHMSNHVLKAHGHVATFIDKHGHGESDAELDDDRLADFIISAIWTVRALGKDPAALVANRMWGLGINPIREQLPPSERGDSP